MGIVIDKIASYVVEGKFIDNIRKEVDEGIARVGRYAMAMTSKSDPNKIFFHTQEDKYTCNPKYICEEFRKRGIDVDMVWRHSAGLPRGKRRFCRVL